MHKHNTRINKRRVRNINALRVLAMYNFPDYLKQNKLDTLSDKKKSQKFKRFFVEWMDYDLSYDYWRHIEKGRNLCTNDLIIHLEDKLKLEKGMLDIEDENKFNKLLHFYNCIFFVGDYIKSNNSDINEHDASALASRLYDDTDIGQTLTNELLSRYI